MFKQKFTTVSRYIYQCCQQYGRHGALGVLLGFAIGFSIAGPPLPQQSYQAHFLQIYTIPDSRRKTPTVKKPAVTIPKVVTPPAPLLPETVPSPPVPVRVPEKEPLFEAAEEEPADTFPAFGKAIYPIAKAPNWGAMRTPAEWERIYPEFTESDFVEIPRYSLSVLQTPLNSLTKDLTLENIANITAKLFYSTRFFGRYHVDSGEYEGRHAGIDFKLAAGTPVGSIAGGMVHATGVDDFLGNYVMIEHKLPTGLKVISIYGHLERIGTTEGQVVKPGTPIGTVGSTGASSGPHLHLQIDIQKSPERHVVYAPDSVVSHEVASQWTLHPIEFISQW